MGFMLADRRSKPRPWRALGLRVAAGRKAARMTQYEMADAAGISRGYPPLIESGQNRPDAEILRRIAKVLGIEYGELAALAGYADAPADDNVPAPPGYRSIVARLIERYTPAQLTRLERAADAFFFEGGATPEQPPHDARDRQRGEDSDEPEPDLDTLGA